MTRIVPPEQSQGSTKLPKWLDSKKIVDAAAAETALTHQAMQNTAATAVPAVTTAYACTVCSKVYQIDNPELAKQSNLAAHAGKAAEYVCPSCGQDLVPYAAVSKISKVDEIRSGDEFAVARDLQKTASGTYNTFVDRHLSFKAIEKLRDYSSKQGMTQATVRYLQSVHSKIAGQEFPTLNAIACLIEWRFGKNQKLNVTANVEIQPDGNFKMPKVFKTSEGTVVPFEKEEIQALEKASDYSHEKSLPHRKSDQTIYKRQDPSNFRALASEGVSTDESITADLVTENLKKKSVVNPQPGVQNPAPQVAPAGGPAQQFQPGQDVVNPANGQTYKIQTVTPGQGAQAVDSTTNQPVAIPENQMQGLKPAVRTTSQQSPPKMASFNDIVTQLLQDQGIEVPPLTMSDDQRFAAQASLQPKFAHVSTMSANWQEIRKGLLEKQAKAAVDPTGHSKVNNIPMGETKDVVMGLTEFPKDQKKEDSTGSPLDNTKGYRIPFEKMNENQVADREHFENEQRLPAYRKKREEDSTYAPINKDQNLGLTSEPDKNTNDGKDFIEAALARAIGIQKHSIELDTTPPEDEAPELPKKPLEYRQRMKAPGISEYKEPDSIPMVSGRAKEAVTKLRKVQQAVAEVTGKMLEALKPLQQQIADVQKPYSEDLKSKQDELKKYYELIYSALKMTEERVGAYENSILAAIEREVPTGKPANLDEVIKKAETVAPEILQKLSELVAMIESERASSVLEQVLYEYPVSKSQEKKIRTSLLTAAEQGSADSFLAMLKNWLDGIHQLMEELGEPAPAGV